MTPKTTRSLVEEFRKRAGNCGQNLAAEAAWLAAVDLLEDAVKQDRHLKKIKRKPKKK